MKKTKLTEEEKYKKLIDQDRMESPSDPDSYTESQDVIDSANSALSKGKKMINVTDTQSFMKMSSKEKNEFLKGVQDRMKKRQGK